MLVHRDSVPLNLRTRAKVARNEQRRHATPLSAFSLSFLRWSFMSTFTI